MFFTDLFTISMLNVHAIPRQQTSSTSSSSPCSASAKRQTFLFYLKGSNGDKCAEGRIDGPTLSIHFAHSRRPRQRAKNRIKKNEVRRKYPEWRNIITILNGKSGKWQDINWIHWPFSTSSTDDATFSPLHLWAAKIAARQPRKKVK